MKTLTEQNDDDRFVVAVTLRSAMIVVGCAIVGCQQVTHGVARTADSEPLPSVVATETSSMHEAVAADTTIRVITRKVVASEQSVVAPEDPYEALYARDRELTRRTQLLASRAIESLPPAEATYVSTIYRLYSTGEFLRELLAWSRDNSNGDLLKPEDVAELHVLCEAWNARDAMMAELAH